MLALAAPVNARQSSTYVLSAFMVLGSTRTMAGLPPVGPGTVIQKRLSPASQSGCSRPPAPLKTMVPSTAYGGSEEMNVAYGSIGQCAAGFAGVGQILVGDRGALLAMRIRWSFGSYPSSSARPHQWPLGPLPSGYAVSQSAIAVEMVWRILK